MGTKGYAVACAVIVAMIATAIVCAVYREHSKATASYTLWAEWVKTQHPRIVFVDTDDKKRIATLRSEGYVIDGVSISTVTFKYTPVTAER